MAKTIEIRWVKAFFRCKPWVSAENEVKSTECSNSIWAIWDQLPNVIVSPHNAGVTYGTARKRNRVMVENIDRFDDGRELLYRIDQERPE